MCNNLSKLIDLLIHPKLRKMPNKIVGNPDIQI